jgi:hypothetical protein
VDRVGGTTTTTAGVVGAGALVPTCDARGGAVVGRAVARSVGVELLDRVGVCVGVVADVEGDACEVTVCCGWVAPTAATKAVRVRVTVAMPWAIRH